MSKPSGSPVSSTAIWILGLGLTSLILISIYVRDMWFAGMCAVVGLSITVYFALKAGKDERNNLEQTLEQEDALEAVTKDAAILRHAITNSALPLAACAKGEVITAASVGFARYTGRTPDKLIGQSVADVLGAEIAHSIASSQSGSFETTLPTGGTDLPVTIFTGRQEEMGAGIVAIVEDSGQSEALAKCQQQHEEFMTATRAINELAQRLASSSELMSAYADDQASGAKRQKEQTVSVAESIETMMGAVMEVATNATATSEAAEDARGVAREGVNQVHQAVEGINALSESAEVLAQELAGLDSQAAEIGRIIGVINDIADQTNLLALNAAIEAARAGDAGRGFAVVADEVRKLAEKTMTATQEVEQAIHNIQNSSKEAMQSMDRTGKQVADSTDRSNQAGQSLGQVMEKIEAMVDRVGQIAAAADEQSQAAEEISTRVDEIADIARDADEGATQQAYATKDLASLSSELLGLSQDLSGNGKGSNITSSVGQMKGILPKLIQDFVKESYSPDVYEAMQDALGDPVFLATESYPDAVMQQMAEAISAASGTPVKNVLYDLGEYTIVGFHKLYKRFFKTKDLKAFYMTLNETHAEVIKNMPGVQPPRFTFEDKGDELFMNYQSKRGLFDYFEGILNGAAKFFDQRADITVKILDKETARAEIKFLDCETKTKC